RNVGKSPVTVVAIKLVGAIAGQVDVRKAIVIVVGHSTAAVPAGMPQMRLGRDVGKGSVTVVAKKIIVGMKTRCLRLSRGSVNQKDILESIVVVIDEARTRSVHI